MPLECKTDNGLYYMVSWTYLPRLCRIMLYRIHLPLMGYSGWGQVQSHTGYG